MARNPYPKAAPRKRRSAADKAAMLARIEQRAAARKAGEDSQPAPDGPRPRIGCTTPDNDGLEPEPDLWERVRGMV